MNKKRIYKLLIVFVITCSFLFFDDAQAAETTDSNSYVTTSSSMISPRADDIGWRYKTVDGVLYKRQYNYTKKKWIGEWIKA